MSAWRFIFPSFLSLRCYKATGEDLIHRSDDNEEALRTRLELYHSQTTPLVKFYSKLNLHSKVDASKKPEDVWKEVEAAIKARKWIRLQIV